MKSYLKHLPMIIVNLRERHKLSWKSKCKIHVCNPVWLCIGICKVGPCLTTQHWRSKQRRAWLRVQDFLCTKKCARVSKDVFDQRTSTGSKAFSLFICLDAIKFSPLTFFSLLKTIYPRVLTKPLPNDAKSPLPVDVRRSKKLLLKLPIIKLWRENVVAIVILLRDLNMS